MDGFGPGNRGFRSARPNSASRSTKRDCTEECVFTTSALCLLAVVVSSHGADAVAADCVGRWRLEPDTTSDVEGASDDTPPESRPATAQGPNLDDTMQPTGFVYGSTLR